MSPQLTQPVLRILAVVVALSATPTESRGQVTEAGLDLFGASWHYTSRSYFDGTDTLRYEQSNPGAGLFLRLGHTERHVWHVKLGAFRDSMGNPSLYGGPVWQYRVVAGLHMGGGVLLFRSETYVTPVIPLPLVTYRAGPVGLNMTWVPAGNEYASSALAFFGTVALWRRR